MERTANVFARVESEVEEQAEQVLDRFDILMSNAVGIFLRQVVLQRGISFEMKLPDFCFCNPWDFQINRNFDYENVYLNQIYKRAISAKATKKYFDYILREYGQKGLNKALDATRQHIEYRKECGLTPDAIETLCDEYEQKE